jgi:hypothetical protein
MAEPVMIGGRSFGGAAFPDEPPGSRLTRARRALRGCVRAVLGWATTPARLLPGAAALGCTVAGTYLLAGVGWALLSAVPFLLLLDARTPRG